MDLSEAYNPAAAITKTIKPMASAEPRRVGRGRNRALE